MAMGLPPSEVRRLSLSDFSAAVQGFRISTGQDKPDKMTEREALDLREELWPEQA